MTERINEMDTHYSDSYFFSTDKQSELLREVEQMEANSRWIKDVTTNEIQLSAPGTSSP